MEKDTEPLGKCNDKEIYYVGIGASAGGLEALQKFFMAIPINSGMVFIVIQHLSPDYKSLMNELLSRVTEIPIKVASDGMETEPNTIYLIPPKYNISISNKKLYLEGRKDRNSLNLPIDIFFRSLAADIGKKSVGIILSGTGSDGTLGIRAIKESGGLVMVQECQSAKFDGMPRSALSTHLVDYILLPEKMGEELINYIKHPLINNDKEPNETMSQNSNTITKITLLLREFSGIDFRHYKDTTLIRRLERRISINRLNTMEEYLNLLYESDEEKLTLKRELLIGVTNFFRDREAFKIINENVFPDILKKCKKAIRIWSAGCSTGEEVYSLAIILKELIDKNSLQCEVKIFATDIDPKAIETAGNGFYSDSIVSDLEPHLLNKYFDVMENGYQVKEFLRKMIIFANHNILKDPPFSRLDMLVCRNLFIYIKPNIQQKLLRNFYYSLKPEGYLFLGSSESLGEMGEAYDIVNSKWKIFRAKSDYKQGTLENLIMPETPALGAGNYSLIGDRPVRRLKSDKIMENVLNNILPPSVIVDGNGDIIHIINDMNKFFDIKAGKFSSSILQNILSGLVIFVSNILRNLKNEKKNITLANITGIYGFENQQISIKGSVIHSEDSVLYLLSFITSEDINNIEDVKDFNMGSEIKNRVLDLETELQLTQENLQATVEELETSNEELQSSNEELIASNEELQSTNEELQSVNEELYTVNSEYQMKIDELTKANNDLNNLLKNTDVGALYLDNKMRIRKITPVVSEITNVLPTDIGRPISHISFINDYKDILDDIAYAKQKHETVEREIRDSDGKAWMVKINPYRTECNVIDGVILTFVDIDALKKEELLVLESNRRLQQALDIGNMAWWEWNLEDDLVIYDDKKATMIGYTVEEFPNNVEEICALIHPDDYEKTMQAMKDHLTGKTDCWEVTYRIKRKDGGFSIYHDRGTVVKRDEEGHPQKLIGTVMDITALK